MADIVYAENSSLGILKPEFKPENMQISFEARIAAEREKLQKCSEDGFLIKSALNEIKRNIHERGLISKAEELEQKSIEDLRTMLTERKNDSDGEYTMLHEFAEKLVLQADNKTEIANASANIQETERYAEFSRNYGDEFSYLYQFRERALANEEFREDDENVHHVQYRFDVVDVPENTGIMSQAEKFRQDAMGGLAKTLVMEVQIEDEVPFNLSVKPFDELDNETQKKIQITFNEEAVQKLVSGSEEENKAKIEKILKFCDDNGLSTADISFPTDREGNIKVDEKLHSLMEQVQAKINEENLQRAQEEDKHREEELIQLEIEYSRDDENDLPPTPNETSAIEENTETPTSETKKSEIMEKESADEPFTELTRGAPAPAPAPAPAQRRSARTPSPEEVFIDMSENDLGRQNAKSYFRRKHNNWNVYIFYDKDVKYNKPVEQDKKGNIQYNYAFKLYFRTDENGILHLSYRTPNGRKVDPAYTDAIAGKLKDLNITHFRIPKGWRADDVGTWRKSLAEKGIVPTGISLNRSKVEAMLKAAKEKLSDEAYNTYKYRLGLQMERYNREKGKHPDSSEQAYIDGLINSKKYGAFIQGYNEVLKSEMRKNFRSTENPYYGPYSAVAKIANFRSLRRLYDIYKTNMDNNGSILASLEPHEQVALRAAAATDPGLLGSIRDFRPDQMSKLYNILHKHSREIIDKKIDDALVLLYDPASVCRKKDTRPARTIINQILNDEKDLCKDIIDDLLANGQDELKLVESVGNLEYDYEGRHPAPATPRTASTRSETSKVATTSSSIRERPVSPVSPVKGRDSY